MVGPGRHLLSRPAAVPRTGEALTRIADNIGRAQDALARSIAIENPSHYLHISGHEWDEIDFLAELAARTGCALLLDVNNVQVSATISAIPPLLTSIAFRARPSPRSIWRGTRKIPTLAPMLYLLARGGGRISLDHVAGLK